MPCRDPSSAGGVSSPPGGVVAVDAVAGMLRSRATNAGSAVSNTPPTNRTELPGTLISTEPRFGRGSHRLRGALGRLARSRGGRHRPYRRAHFLGLRRGDQVARRRPGNALTAPSIRRPMMCSGDALVQGFFDLAGHRQHGRTALWRSAIAGLTVIRAAAHEGSLNPSTKYKSSTDGRPGSLLVSRRCPDEHVHLCGEPGGRW